eukprot:TRINITY_DN1018_c0_g1_i2.p1 TRINITY_DN1018_c0_g1~~TRINITY_DN1018_c0_g1_i2.p1  ORF type:complete len:296 (-),score=99.68 TRINITY_DN1018_c0_g1_i2:116-1003(-)
MRFGSILGCGLAVSLCLCGANAKGNRWTRKKDKEQEENGFDQLIKLKKPEAGGVGAGGILGRGPAAGAGGMEQFMRTLQAGVGDEGLDMQKMVMESVNTLVDILSDPEQRKVFDRESIEAMFKQLPPEIMDTPELAAAAKQNLALLEELDPKEYEKQVNEILDSMLDYAKKMQDVLKDPDALNKLMSDTLGALGLTEEDLAEAQKLLSDPKAMQDAMSALSGLKEEDFAELSNLLGDPSAMDSMMKNLMNDPEMEAALKDPNLAGMYEELMKDPELQAAMGQASDAAKPARRQRA